MADRVALNEAELERALREVLPPEMVRGSAAIARAIVALGAGTATPSTVSGNPELARLFQALAGSDLRTPEALISFGAGTEAGDVTIGDVAGGNVVKITINMAAPTATVPTAPLDGTLPADVGLGPKQRVLAHLLALHEQQLHELLEQQARIGPTIPAEIKHAIEAEQGAVQQLRAQIAHLSAAGTAPAPGSLDALREELAWLEAGQRYGESPERFQARIEDLKATIAGWDHRVEAQLARIAAGIAEVRRQADTARTYRQTQRRFRSAGRRPLGDVSHVRNRQRESELIADLLCMPATRMVSIIGHGGMGKTALACKVLHDLEHSPGPATEGAVCLDGSVYLSTRTAGISLERLFLDCARMLGDEAEQRLNLIWTDVQLTVADKITRLLEALQHGHYVILLDNLEDLLDDSGHLINPDLQQFLACCLTGAHGARLLVTSRRSLVLAHELIRCDHQVKLLEGLPIPDGVALLRELDPNGEYGLRDTPEPQLARVVTQLHGVPRALEVIAGILADDPFSTLDDVLQHFYRREEVAVALIEENYGRLDEPARRVIEALAVLGRPVPQAAVDFLLAPFVPGIDVPGILRRLARANILRIDRADKRLHLHPIDQDYAYSQLPEERADPAAYSRTALERRAGDYYAQLRTAPESWHSLADLEPQLAEFEHRVRAGDYPAAHLLLDEIDAGYLFPWGHCTRLVEMRERLIGVLGSSEQQIANFNRLGLAYQMLGQAQRAATLYEQALELARQTGDRRAEATLLGLVGSARHDLGRFREAITYHEQALQLGRAIGDRVIEGTELGRLGLIYHALRQFEAAIAHYEQAAAIFRQLGDRWNERIWLGNLGRTYRNIGQIEQAIGYFEQALEVATELGDRHEEAFWYDRLGIAYRPLGQIERAVELHERAITISRAIGDRRGEGAGLSNVGDAYLALGAFTQAREAYRRGGEIAREIGDRRGETICLGRLGNTYVEAGTLEPARAPLETALSIAREIGDQREESYQLWRLGKLRLAEGDLAEARRLCLDAVTLNNPETSYLAAATLAIVLLRLHDAGAPPAFADAQARCRAVLGRTSGLYEARYTLALSLAGSAVCDPRWAAADQRDGLLAPARAAYQEALASCSQPGVVNWARRTLGQLAAGSEDPERIAGLLVVDQG